MRRRGLDYACSIFGVFLLVVGIFTYTVPEITYRSSREVSVETLISQAHDEETIFVPRPLSLGLMAAGVLLIYKSLKIKKRGAQL